MIAFVTRKHLGARDSKRRGAREIMDEAQELGFRLEGWWVLASTRALGV